MALKLNVVLANGLQAPDSYVRVQSVQVINKTEAYADVVYQSKKENTISYQTKIVSFTYALDGKNVLAQTYEHLKTTPEFAAAIDC
jgi:uridine kinase